MTHPTLNSLTKEEVALLAKHLDALDAETLRCRRIASDLLREVSAELRFLEATTPEHPLALRAREVLDGLRGIAGLRDSGVERRPGS